MAYEVLETRVEEAEAGQLRVITTLGIVADGVDADEAGAGPHRGGGGGQGSGLDDDGLGEGPTRDTVPDRIVLTLIAGAGTSMAAAEIKAKVGGNPGTVNRQCWTLAGNEPDTPHRLRGWVVTPERGRYALSAAARRRLEDDEARAHWMERARRYK